MIVHQPGSQVAFLSRVHGLLSGKVTAFYSDGPGCQIRYLIVAWLPYKLFGSVFWVWQPVLRRVEDIVEGEQKQKREEVQSC